jgi:hypothetical protein
MAEDPATAAGRVADHLHARGHQQHAAHLRSVLLDNRLGSALLTALREACQTILTAIEAIDPVSATMVEELRVDVDAWIKPPPGHPQIP